MDLKISRYEPNRPSYGPRLSKEEWEQYKPILVELESKGFPRHEIVRIAAAEHGFRGTYGALNTRFKQWGLTTPREDEPGHSQVAESESVTNQAASDPPLSYGDSRENPSSTESDNNIADAAAAECNTCGMTAAATNSERDADISISTFSSFHLVETPAVANSTTDEVDNIAAREHSSEHIAHALTTNFDKPEEDGVGALLTLQGLEAPGSVASKDTSKRRRSHSSIRSSILSVSTDTGSFIRFAKRVRQTPTIYSLSSSLKLLSVSSLRKSNNFADVTDFEQDLDTVEEFFPPPPKRYGKKTNHPSDHHIPLDEYTHWHEMNNEDIENINHFLRSNTWRFSRECYLRPWVLLPMLIQPQLEGLVQKYPRCRAVLIDTDIEDTHLLVSPDVVYNSNNRLPIWSHPESCAKDCCLDWGPMDREDGARPRLKLSISERKAIPASTLFPNGVSVENSYPVMSQRDVAGTTSPFPITSWFLRSTTATNELGRL